MATASAKVEPPKSTFFGYNQARTISNISAHGSSTFNFCKDKTPLRNAMCLVVEELVKMYSTVCFGDEYRGLEVFQLHTVVQLSCGPFLYDPRDEYSIFH